MAVRAHGRAVDDRCPSRSSQRVSVAFSCAPLRCLTRELRRVRAPPRRWPAAAIGTRARASTARDLAGGGPRDPHQLGRRRGLAGGVEGTRAHRVRAGLWIRDRSTSDLVRGAACRWPRAWSRPRTRRADRAGRGCRRREPRHPAYASSSRSERSASRSDPRPRPRPGSPGGRTVHEALAPGDSTLPARSVERTSTVWLPTPSAGHLVRARARGPGAAVEAALRGRPALVHREADRAAARQRQRRRRRGDRRGRRSRCRP